MADDTHIVPDTTVPEAGTYEIDATRSVARFAVRHLGFARVRGRFREMAGTVEIAEDIAGSSAHATIQAASFDTGDQIRDGFVRSADFLDVEHHPTLEFHSTGLRPHGRRGSLDGDLTIRDVTRPVSFEVTFEGGEVDDGGAPRIRFSARTELNREDFGLTWNQALETGGLLVGKQVKVELSIEAVGATRPRRTRTARRR